MKKTISLFLALVLLMSVFSLVFADEIGEQLNMSQFVWMITPARR